MMMMMMMMMMMKKKRGQFFLLLLPERGSRSLTTTLTLTKMATPLRLCPRNILYSLYECRTAIAPYLLNQCVSYSSSNRFNDDNNSSIVTKTKVSKNKDESKLKATPSALCGDDESDDEDEDTMEQMFIMGPSVGKVEWGGPTRGGARPEPTRYGDWERKGRASDF